MQLFLRTAMIMKHVICATQKIGSVSHLPARLQALEELKTQRITYSCKNYELSQEVINTLHQHQYNERDYSTCYGNTLQHVIHQECIDVLARTTHIIPQSVLHDYKEDVIGFTDCAREYNQQGARIRAMTTLDFCHTLLDYGLAILEGAAYGLLGAAKSVVENPVESLLAAISIKYLLIYQATKLVANVAFIGVSYSFDHEQGAQQWNDFIQPIERIIEFCKKRELEVTVRDCCKAGAYITTAVVTQKKLLNRLGRLFKKTKIKAVTYQKAHPSATPAQYATTAEGRIPESLAKWANLEPTECPASCVNQLEKLKLSLRIEEFTSIINVTKHGILRLIERGFTPEDVLELINRPTFKKIQTNGLISYVKQIDMRYNVIILNEREHEVITALKGLEEKALKRIGKKYGWK